MKVRLERPAELVGAKPLHLLTQTALPLKSPTGAFIATLRSANAVAPNAKYQIILPLNMAKAHAEAIPNRPASKKAAAKWQAFGGSCAAHGDAAAQWTFCAIYDFSVKKTAAGLIFWPFSCKLKDNHARVFFARQNPAKRATHGIKIAKNNGA